MTSERAADTPEGSDGRTLNVDGTRDETRLYGVPGAEHLHFDPAACYETDIECWVDEHDRRPRLIEEWSVKDCTDHLPAADDLLLWMVEWTGDHGELDEDGFGAFENASKKDDVVAAAEALRTLLASKVGYRMADQHLRTLTVTWDDQGEPLLDGEPMYVKAAQ